MRDTHSDPLAHALTELFKLCTAAKTSLPDILELMPESSDLRRRVFRLTGTLDTPQLLSREAACDLEQIAQKVEKQIAAGTSRGFVHNEGDVSGGQVQAFMSRAAEALSEAARPLRNFEKAWQDVQNARAVEKALEKARS
jgi:hypothetical protein